MEASKHEEELLAEALLLQEELGVDLAEHVLRFLFLIILAYSFEGHNIVASFFFFFFLNRISFSPFIFNFTFIPLDSTGYACRTKWKRCDGIDNFK